MTSSFERCCVSTETPDVEEKREEKILLLKKENLMRDEKILLLKEKNLIREKESELVKKESELVKKENLIREEENLIREEENLQLQSQLRGESP